MDEKHVPVSEKNPALVLFVVDVSLSMKKSGNIDNVLRTIPPLKSIAVSKPGQIRLGIISFDSHANEITNDPLEEASTEYTFQTSHDNRTNLKAAAKLAREVYHKHVRKYCKSRTPLASILFFTDGGHTNGIDYDRNVQFGNLVKNKWFDYSVDEFLDFGENVICGLVDYNKNSKIENFPSEIESSKNKLSKVSRLSEKIVTKAYARDKSHPPAFGHDLEAVFGPKEHLQNNFFIISSSVLKKSPSVTSAFVRLGTYSSTANEVEKNHEYDDDTNWDDDI